MQLNDLQQELDKHFTFASDYSPSYLECHEQFRALRNQAYTNIELTSPDYPVKGIAQHFHMDNEGAVIFEYAFCKEIRRSGRQLTGALVELQDCEHHYYGLKLSCLALLSGKHIKKLILRDSYNGQSIAITYNPRIAQAFLASITESVAPAARPVHKLQPSLFA